MDSEEIKKEIVKRVTDSAEQKRTNAGYAGMMGDGGASQLEDRLAYWVDGIVFAATGKTEKYKDLVQDIKNDADPEYQEYLRLKEKFEK